MEELIKKVLYTGVGLVASATEKVQQQVNDLVENDKISKDEGKKIVESFVKSTEEKKSELETRLNEMVEGIINKLDLVRKSDIDDLIKKVERLEKEAADAE